MKKINFKQTFINGLFLALPLLAIFYIGIKIVRIIEEIISPLAQKIGIQHLLGELTLTVFALVILLIFFLILGVLLHMNLLRELNKQLESVAYKLIPRLYKVKALTSENGEQTFSKGWKPILLKDDESWVPAYITEENETWVIVYIPDAPDGISGAIKMLDASGAIYKPIDGFKLHGILHGFGKGMIAEN